MRRRSITRPPSVTYVQPATYYYAPPAPVTPISQSASIRVLVPDAKAKVWFDGTLTKQTGTDRNFHTPELAAGTYTYRIRAAWGEGAAETIQERVVSVQPGQTSIADFRSEPVPAPK